MKVPMSKQEGEAITNLFVAASAWLIYVCRVIKNGPGPNHETTLNETCATVVRHAAKLSETSSETS